MDNSAASGHTPMMAQYHAVKAAHPDCLLFYRMGDFFEMFFDDAVTASKILDLTLTKRGKTQGEDIPMCGVPFHSSESYIARLIRAGHKVAICEQVETPEDAKKRGGYKALVRREVIRVITPGTLVEDNLLDARSNNYLAAINTVAGQYCLGLADVSTGHFFVQTFDATQIKQTLARYAPNEIICPAGFETQFSMDDAVHTFTTQPASLFESGVGAQKLRDVFGDMDTGLSRAEVSVAGAILSYIDETQKGKLPYLSAPQKLFQDQVMEIDSITLRSLEIIRTQSGERRGSLIDIIDNTLTSAGARLLQSRILSPARDVHVIAQRHNEIEDFRKNFDLTKSIRAILKSVPDMERSLARLSVQHGGPRDLAALRTCLEQAGLIHASMTTAHLTTSSLAPSLNEISLTPGLQNFLKKLQSSLVESPPLLARDGHFIAGGYCEKLDHVRALKTESNRHIAELQARYIADTGIETLKITYNNILGFFIEVPARRAEQLLVKSGDQTNPFIHRQTMSNAVRFTTPDLSQLERAISSAADQALAIELQYFDDLTQNAILLGEEIHRVAQGLAKIDIATSVAEQSIEKNYTRPVVTTGSEFMIEGGRHPVVEDSLTRQNMVFAANACDLSPHQKLWLLTGPNMAGKSTFLRQNALIAIMAQAGLFVPATTAHIGIIDKVFSRVGASDDLARGHSTFMTEMVETSAILQNATPSSLVILDEIGRGTSTFDGLSIAWATLEYLHNVTNCRGIFATHYHELTELKDKLATLFCATMDVKEWQDDVIFLHHVMAGTADRSYGIHVAKLAGLPDSVVERAQTVLNSLEEKKSRGKNIPDLPLFSAPPARAKPSAVEEHLATINPDTLTPREALDEIYKLKTVMTIKPNK